MSTDTHLITAEELMDLPDGHRYELVKGVLLTMSPSGFEHGMVTANVTLLLATYIKAHNLGFIVVAETGFKLEHNPDTVLAPDFAFIRKDRRVVRTPSYLEIPPDLAVEVISSTKTRREAQRKAAQWLSFGVQSVWIVNCQKHTVEVASGDGSRTLFTESDELSDEHILPGFRVTVSEIFN
jgi:Uma2 family endonuclease